MRANERANLIASHVARRAKVNPRTYLSSQHHSYERGGIKINDSDAAMRYSRIFVDAKRYSRLGIYIGASGRLRKAFGQKPSKSIQEYSNRFERVGSRSSRVGGRGREGEMRRGTDGVPTKRETKCFRQKWANGAHSIGFEAVRYVTRMSAIIYVVLLVG